MYPNPYMGSHTVNLVLNLYRHHSIQTKILSRHLHNMYANIVMNVFSIKKEELIISICVKWIPRQMNVKQDITWNAKKKFNVLFVTMYVIKEILAGTERNLKKIHLIKNSDAVRGKGDDILLFLFWFLFCFNFV